ncbi:ester cyclase [Francisella adeliensis]|uniref:Ester cyclase n=1 Tax=Francisella adeliensis TaxID=2007306 RepID=A0A2Z4XWN1_9GAMM|nr:ester cyclase [Francisella adeliensis]AXA33281.1 polyketide cyclase [Francisella adeliensis]MBK2084991.1 ester cyclase [Francisella adeliensis]MBK2097017.1 ester cyclase [Francisella adeliensis]QIW11509.1 ester cyclase [Francisella adeliensis]QIW13384.1 ester cyclase [Francisella adeliensis]
MSDNLSKVKEYFKYCVDGKQTNLIPKYFHENVVIHRPDCSAPLIGLDIFEKSLRGCVTDRYETINTTFQKEIVSGNEVVVALTHFATGSNTWKGHEVSGKDVQWTSLTYFKFDNDGFIIEEIVERNELAMAEQLGISVI